MPFEETLVEKLSAGNSKIKVFSLTENIDLLEGSCEVCEHRNDDEVYVYVKGQDKDDHAEHSHDHAEHSHDHAEHSHEHAEHSHDHAEHSHDHAEHSHDHAEHGHDHAEHGHDHAEHGHEHAEHGHDHAEHGHDHAEHSHDHAEHSHDHAEHGHDHAEHGHDHAEHGHDHAEHGHDHAEHGHDHAEHGHDHAEHGHDHAEHGHDHAEHGHEHAHHDHELDPHVWLSPKILKAQASTMAGVLKNASPETAEQIDQNLKSLLSELDALDTQLAEQLAFMNGQTFYVYHGAFAYFAEAYGLKQESIEIGGRRPEPKRLATLVEKAKKEGVKLIFVQPQFDQTSAKSLAEAIGGKVLPLDPLEEDVFSNLTRIAETIGRQSAF